MGEKEGKKGPTAQKSVKKSTTAKKSEKSRKAGLNK
jgi:hypothetical protein